MQQEPYNHIRKNDYTCPRCGMLVQIWIPHECDPSICIECNGYGHDWKNAPCEPCSGTGKTQWKDDDGITVAPV